jgi:hypothetical protein
VVRRDRLAELADQRLWCCMRDIAQGQHADHALFVV